jgi:hypothetical protein
LTFCIGWWTYFAGCGGEGAFHGGGGDVVEVVVVVVDVKERVVLPSVERMERHFARKVRGRRSLSQDPSIQQLLTHIPVVQSDRSDTVSQRQKDIWIL